MRQLLALLFLGAVGFLLFGSPLWLLYAVLASFLLGLLFLLDAFFFRKSVYLAGGWEPTAISGFMQLAPWLVVPWVVDVRWSEVSLVAASAGFLSMVSFIAYFRAMDSDHDVVAVSILWNLKIAIVPILAFSLLDERLAVEHYLGIALVFLGAIIGSWEKTAIRAKVVGLMLTSVMISSVHSIVGKGAVDSVTDWQSFWNVFLFFSVGEAVVALIAVIVIGRREPRHFREIISKFWVAFVLIELCQVMFSIASWKAVSLGPVSFVAAVEALSGAFIIFLCLVSVVLFHRTRYAETTKDMLKKQLGDMSRWWRLLVGTVILIIGVFLLD